MSRLVAGRCNACGGWPCKCRTPYYLPKNEISDGSEWKELDMGILLARLFVALRDHIEGRCPAGCVSCRGLLAQARIEFERMDLPTP